MEPENIPARLGEKKLKEEMAETVRVQKVILKALRKIEIELDEEIVEAGEYHGIKFE